MTATCKFDARHFLSTFRKLCEIGKKDARKELRVQAKGFIRKVIDITPPSIGKATSAAKQKGESAIRADLAKIMRPVRSGKGKQLESAEAIWKRLRVKSTGRVNPRNLKTLYPVSYADYQALQKRLVGEVGILAAGWNAAAAQLGAAVPAWIKRHGNSHGSIQVLVHPAGMRIRMTNVVRFADNVHDLERRMQWALKAQTAAMQRQVNHLLTKAGKKAGFKK